MIYLASFIISTVIVVIALFYTILFVGALVMWPVVYVSHKHLTAESVNKPKLPTTWEMREEYERNRK